MKPKATSVTANRTHQTNRMSSEDYVQVIEETQESETQSKTMSPNIFDPVLFFDQDKIQVHLMEADQVNTHAGVGNKRSASSTLLLCPPVFQNPRESDIKKRPKHAKSATALQTLQTKWNCMFHRLVDYKQVHGDCLVPNRYKSDMPLGLWVSTQRRQVCMCFTF